MRQAQTLNEAQLRRVLHYTGSRRHPVRDRTIIMVSFYAGLRAKEIAALTVGNVFDEQGAVREQFILSAAQSKGGQTRTVYLNQRLRKALADYGDTIKFNDPKRALFASQKGGAFSANTMCQLFLDIYKAMGVKGCVKPFRAQNLHHQISEQGRGCAVAGRTGRACAHFDNTAIHRRKF